MVKSVIRRLWQEEQGQDLIEYVLLVALMALGAVAAMKSLAYTISDTFSRAAINLMAASS
jgi:pilus assembly protein Flp/PilA